MHRLALCATVLAVGLLAQPALAADSSSLKPGLWDFEMTTTMPAMPAPKTQKTSQCIEKGDSDPLTAMTRDSGCTVSDRQQTDDTLRWQMECPGGMPGQTMKGKGEITTDGNSATGKMEITMSLQGQAMTLTSIWSGKRRGPCKP